MNSVIEETMMSEDTNRLSSQTLHPARLSDTALLAVSDVRRQRRSGPGGQHRNKVETGIVLVHRPTGIRAEATERRSQAENQRVALGRLRLNLALQVRKTYNIASAPSPEWRARTHGKRISVSPHHVQFPALLAEALDVLHEVGYDLPKAARLLDITSSQLVRFLKLEPRALHIVNEHRQNLGQRPYR